MQYLRLEDLERRALTANPTVAQAEAIARSVAGRQRQVSLYPNPLVGYAAEDIAAREPARGKHFVWAQQSIITAGKRDLVHRAVAQEAVHAAAEQDMQRLLRRWLEKAMATDPFRLWMGTFSLVGIVLVATRARWL